MILLYGPLDINAGPCNVNKSLIDHSNGEIAYVKFQKKYLRLFEGVIKVLLADSVVLSSITSMSVFIAKLAKLFRKKTIYLKHGDADYEAVINKLNIDRTIRNEKIIMEYADLILCVSRQFMQWNKKRYPQYNNKISYLNNGVNIRFRKFVEKLPRSIVVTGGNRNIKNNRYVYEAVKKLNDISKEKYTLYVCGHYYENNEVFGNKENVFYVGQLEKEEYYCLLDKMELMIMNSKLESFGLAIADGLNANCSLLLSKNVGAASILKMEKSDYIENSYDIDEIVKKIKWIFNNPNVKRLQESVDIYKASEEYAAKRLSVICKHLF